MRVQHAKSFRLGERGQLAVLAANYPWIPVPGATENGGTSDLAWANFNWPPEADNCLDYQSTDTQIHAQIGREIPASLYLVKAADLNLDVLHCTDPALFKFVRVDRNLSEHA